MSSTVSGSEHIRHEVVVCGGSNAVFNGLSAWLLMKSGPNLQWGGDHSFVIDIVATGFILPLIVAFIVIPLQRNKLGKGKLQPVNLGASSFVQSLADRFPSSTAKSALLFGLIGMLIIAPLTLAGLYVFGVQLISPAYYAVFKGVWAGLMAAILVVPMVLVALREPTLRSSETTLA